MITDAQRDLVAAIEACLHADPDIEAAWLAGSLGMGGGDAFSDVDVLVLTAHGRVADVVQRYGADLSGIAPAVLVNILFGRVLSVVTDDWRRFDLSFVQGAELDRYDRARLTPMFNRTGREPPLLAPTPYQPRPDDLTRVVEEFFRVQGLGVVGLGRREYVVCLSGIELLRKMTVDLMLDENGVGPAERGGALRRNPMLTAEQRAELAALAPVPADHDGVLAANLALAAIFLPRARRLAQRIGALWPRALEAATQAHLAKHLGVQLPG
jgi:hypothetical protein